MQDTSFKREPTPAIDPAEYIPTQIMALSNALLRRASQSFMSRFGIGVTEWRIFSALALAQNVSATHLSYVGDIDKAALSRCLRHLENTGHVRFTRDQRDPRRRTVSFTAAGVALYNKVLDYALNRETLCLRGFSPEEAETLRAILRKLLTNLSALEPGAPAPAH